MPAAQLEVPLGYPVDTPEKQRPADVQGSVRVAG